ncbi:hypothetical protein ILYODFUR_037123 [Ilyodon furcidens]|uniref:Uncharacterized protein n=1 Tax=Ilyodon furcidens TaxID=33524 RepID=A0ABV0VK81_9TELE
MRQNGGFDPKWPTSCGVWTMGPRDFFVGPEKLHRCTEFHKSRTQHALGLVVVVLLEGAVEQLGHAHQLFHWKYLGGWTSINPIEFGGDRLRNVEITVKRKAMA